jgi:hypothetical protein
VPGPGWIAVLLVLFVEFVFLMFVFYLFWVLRGAIFYGPEQMWKRFLYCGSFWLVDPLGCLFMFGLYLLWQLVVP